MIATISNLYALDSASVSEVKIEIFSTEPEYGVIVKGARKELFPLGIISELGFIALK